MDGGKVYIIGCVENMLFKLYVVSSSRPGEMSVYDLFV